MYKESVTMKNTINSFYQLSLEGDLTSAYNILKKLKKEKRLLDKFEDRFIKKIEILPESENRFINTLLKIYREYWNLVLLKKLDIEDGENHLFDSLRAFMIDSGIRRNFRNINSLEKELKKLIRKNGFYCILGKVLPFRELELWKEEKLKIINIQLIYKTQKIRLIFMKDFLTHGWEEYATLDKYYPGGWAAEKSLYCAEESYKDKDSENFKISYLVHEAQHFSDYKDFTNLDQKYLEFRAKLMELYFANDSFFNILENFINMASNKKSNPHGYANFSIIKYLSRNIFKKKYEDDINQWKKHKIKKIKKHIPDLFDGFKNLL